MRKLGRAIDRFCIKYPRFGIPYLMRFVVFGTGLMFILGFMDTTEGLWPLLSFSASRILQGELWRLISFIIVPWTTSPLFMVIGLYVYYMLGTVLEQTWGTAKFTLYYLSSMLLVVLSAFALHVLGFPVLGFFVSAHYINLTLLLAFATLYPDMEFRLFFILPVKAKWVGIFSGAFFLFEIVRTMAFFPGNLVPLALLFNYLLFCGNTLFSYLGFYRKGHSKSAVHFRRETRKRQAEERAKPYTRKCAVCFKTDTDYPDMEFRFCSKCEGYHCFCPDHIGNHQHLK